jgi:recombinational DNA repair ATPase RecF
MNAYKSLKVIEYYDKLIERFSNELDILRRKKLLEMLGQISGQILITGTDSNTIESANFAEYRHFNVKRGEIAPA